MKKVGQSCCLLGALAVSGLLLQGVRAYAAEPQEYLLDPLVITAQRRETKDLETPASVTVVRHDDFEKHGDSTVMEALRRVTGVTDYSYGPGGDDVGSSYSRVMLRGFDKGALVMVNGAPVNVNNYASVNSIPLDAIDRIEVVKGANSVLYGPEALGGVINIITKKGTGKTRTTIRATGGNYRKAYTVTTQGDGFLFSYNRDYLDEFDHAQMDRPSAGTYRVNGKYQRSNFFTSLALSPDLQLNWNYVKLDPMFGQRDLKTGKVKGTQYDYEDTKHTASLVYTDKPHRIKTILSYNSKKVDGRSITSNVVKRSADSSNYTVSNLYFDTQKEWTFGTGDRDSLIAGVTGKHEKYDQKYANTADNIRNSFGVYASYRKAYNDRFSTILGFRGEHIGHTEFEGEDHNVLLPQFQSLYKVDDKTSWYVNVGRAFEMPAINSHTSSGGTSGDIIRKNGIKPESGWTYETGLKRLTDTSSAKLSVFYMDYKNKFQWKYFDWLPDPKNKIQVNLGKFQNTGVELEYQKNLGDRWDYTLSATYQNPKSQDEETGVWSQESARVQLNASAGYTLHKFRTDLSLLFLGDREPSSYRYNGASASKLGPDHDLKNRVLLNAALKYSPTDNQYVLLNLNNILNRDEPVSTYEYYDLPFNWTVTYNFTF